MHCGHQGASFVEHDLCSGCGGGGRNSCMSKIRQLTFVNQLNLVQCGKIAH